MSCDVGVSETGGVEVWAGASLEKAAGHAVIRPATIANESKDFFTSTTSITHCIRKKVALSRNAIHIHGAYWDRALM